MPSGGGTRALERRGYAVAVISSTEPASGSHYSGVSLVESEEPTTSGRYGHVNSIEVRPARPTDEAQLRRTGLRGCELIT